jgi:hypothetical protein
MQRIRTLMLLMLICSELSVKAQDTTIVSNWRKEAMLRPFRTSEEKVFKKVVLDSAVRYFWCRNLDGSKEWCYYIHVDMIDSFRILMHTLRNTRSLTTDTLLYRTICWTCDVVGDGIGYERPNFRNPSLETLFSIMYEGDYLVTFSDMTNGVYIYRYRLRRYLKENRRILNVSYKESIMYIQHPEHGFMDCVKYLRILDVAQISMDKVLKFDYKRRL